MQTMGCVSEQVAVLVDRAALRWHVAPEGGQCVLQPSAAVDDQKLWLAQPALDEVVENGAASGRRAPAQPSGGGTQVGRLLLSCPSWTPRTQIVRCPRNRGNFISRLLFRFG